MMHYRRCGAIYGVICLLLLCGTQAGFAQTVRTQTVQLHQGWNAVFLLVAPASPKPADCFQGTPVTMAAAFTGDTRQQALISVVQRWAPSDPTATGQWLDTLPADSARESVVQNYISSTAWQYPDIAAPFAETLTDTSQRVNALETVARSWLRSDPSAAAEWLKKTELSEDQKQRLLAESKK